LLAVPPMAAVETEHARAELHEPRQIEQPFQLALQDVESGLIHGDSELI
jgi:hypothetical protein